MALSIAQAATLVGGELCGDGSATISTALPLVEAGPGSITFLADPNGRLKLLDCKAAAVITPMAIDEAPMPIIRVERPMDAMLRIAAALRPLLPKPAPGIDPRAAIDHTAGIGPDCHVGPFAVIEAGAVLGARCIIHAHAVVRAECEIGDDVEIHPHAVLYPRTIVGDRSVIHAGAVIGKEGFGFRFLGERHERVPQLGCTAIGADVEIGAGSMIDKATFGATRVGDGTKLDNQVQIGHNCRIGTRNLLVAQVGMGGSCSTGDRVVIAGQAGIADHVAIGDRAVLGAHSGVHADIPADATVMGAPARPEREAKRILLSLGKLPDLIREMRGLRRKLGLEEGEEAAEVRRAG